MRVVMVVAWINDPREHFYVTSTIGSVAFLAAKRHCSLCFHPNSAGPSIPKP